MLFVSHPRLWHSTMTDMSLAVINPGISLKNVLISRLVTI